ncbi:ferric iron reductase FhuF-like transporter [Novosphingobium kunmingense]|uniref:Ferric iron reductase FhuF-like transporter n=1 Tax=Novosphingobium kunmingense TaxID=1211806 RepID=A0A2N0I2G0_9SPHN|nr:IucA/IucC family protein [Novosphingobium kunmingense]PKB25374.1 ferric iron reductase FhuF-like transporter [Novosphingobium kunmingense]
MNAPPMLKAAGVPDYLTRRVIDALLREDVRECVSRGAIVHGFAHPLLDQLSPTFREGSWLRIDHFDEQLWLAVEPGQFMQDWRFRAFPALSCRRTNAKPLHDLAEILTCFRSGLDPQTEALHVAFGKECVTASEHRTWCEAERTRWFAMPDEEPSYWPAWARSLARHDRLAALHDHPFYPTARAKLGFEAEHLRAYAPEFQPVFALRWLAVPRTSYEGAALPQCLRPSFTDVGLDEALTADHVLMPVHPALWDAGLGDFLAQADLAKAVVRAPRSYLSVMPTLSVRTVVPLSCPGLHLKLPLTIRTLGATNLRTIKPSTIIDGDIVQTILRDVTADLPAISGRLLLTDEATGATAFGQSFLGYILRRYPELNEETVTPVAALAAPAPDGRLTIEALADRFYEDDVEALFRDYSDLLLRLHLSLWLKYGVALEANQQNSLLVFSDSGLRLLLKDNDAARIHSSVLAARRPDVAGRVDAIRDRRIIVDADLPLAQMFITITLQLNIAVIVEALHHAGRADRSDLYRHVRARIVAILEELAMDGINIVAARRHLLEAERLPLKYLLRAASLESKAQTGAADVNKFYGLTAPNFLRQI